ncbi:hypothetical protein [Streptomyces chartreusis]|uniref:hypothetical protein n=1 Tax=Streptomyces chartreusis TaxID=1969 RepID=UPI0038241FF0
MNARIRDYARRIAELERAGNFAEIYRSLVHHEMPWEHRKALEVGLYRTLADPELASLTVRTGRMISAETRQRRYDGTIIFFDELAEFGPDSQRGHAAIRRLNQIHHAFPISDAGFSYTLACLAVTTVEFMDRYGWRKLLRAEIDGICRHYSRTARLMNVHGLPATFDEQASLVARIETTMGFLPDARTVGLASLDMVINWYPRPARRLLRWAFPAFIPDGVKPVFAMDTPRGPEPFFAALCKVRRLIVPLLPQRSHPTLMRRQPHITAFPANYTIDQIGT